MICGVFKAVVVMSAVSSCTAVVLMLTRLLSGGLWSMKLRYRAWIAVLMLAILPFSSKLSEVEQALNRHIVTAAVKRIFIYFFIVIEFFCGKDTNKSVSKRVEIEII